MRLTFLLSALSLASLGAAQTVFVNGAEQLIREAYENQRLNDGLVFEMRGSDVNSGSRTPIHAILYWRLSADPRTRLNSRAQAELDIYEGTPTGEALQMRIVGDGTSLYRYDIARRQVSTTLYGFYGPTPPSNYAGSDAPKLLAQLHTVTPGLSTYLVRLLVEMNPAGAEYHDLYTNWLPGHPAQLFGTVPYPIRQGTGLTSYVKDPITSRVSIEGTDEWVFEGMNRLDTNRTVTFHMIDENAGAENGSPKWVVQTVNVAQRTATRFVDLTLVPNVGTAPGWAFAPYTGAQAAAFRPIAGGF